jgi:hypothetical protein
LDIKISTVISPQAGRAMLQQEVFYLTPVVVERPRDADEGAFQSRNHNEKKAK